MKKLLLVCGALLVALGGVSTHLWRNLRTEQLTRAELGTQLAAIAVSGVAAAPPQLIAVPPPAAMPDCPTAAAVPAPAAAQVSSFLATAEISANAAAEKDLWRDPEYRKAQLTMTRMRLVQSNPGLAETLGLADAEASHLFDVLAEVQAKFLAPLFTGGTAAGAGDSATALTAEELRESAAGGNVVRVTLGEARYAQYEDYQRNGRPVLTQMASLGSTLASAGHPMSDSQSRALTTALRDEQQRQRQEPVVPPRSIWTTLNPGTPRRTIEMLEEDNNRQDAADRRILAAAASSLSPAQLQALREQFDQQAATRRRTLETARGFLAN